MCDRTATKWTLLTHSQIAQIAAFPLLLFLPVLFTWRNLLWQIHTHAIHLECTIQWFLLYLQICTTRTTILELYRHPPRVTMHTLAIFPLPTYLTVRRFSPTSTSICPAVEIMCFKLSHSLFPPHFIDHKISFAFWEKHGIKSEHD